ncbi:uncharacterized protein LOC123541823 [Mercenaria mercenaria]|uniref:uncharacterized protein LOC123541823 n=1 Tax=Mercenaria mercenaria TaxID=6596 RepID=UPI00234F977F|nr:uncharacterized protein LOC123541823 [Mercenaria mercenaria]
MATGHTQRNRLYLFRLRKLLVDGGLLVLRHILDRKLQVRNILFSDCLSQEKHRIIRLKEQNTITQVQYDLLYPPHSKPPSTSDLDITLVICLLRNLASFGLNQNFDWEVAPHRKDASIEADMCRLEHITNEVAEISTTTGMKLADFRFRWTEIEQILLRLNTAVSYRIPNLQQIFDDFKTSNLDQEAEEIIDQILKELREMETTLETNQQSCKTQTEVQKVDTSEFEQQRSEHTELYRPTRRTVAYHESQISKHNEDEFRQKQNVEGVAGSSPDQELITVRAVIRKGWNKLIDYMIPDPILDCATEFHLLRFRDIRDIKEEKNTSDKNRSILRKVISNGEVGFNNLKKCLEKTNQTKLVTILNCIEKGEDTRVLADQLHSEMVSTRHKVSKELKEDLIALYRQQYSTLPLSPLLEEPDTHLLRFYVKPDISSVEIERSFGGGSEIKSPVASLRPMFYKKGKLCRAIYLSANTGLGKTAFCKRLVLTWCQAHDCVESEEKYFEKDDIVVLSKFEFVFFLSLRDCSKECSIDEMIMKNITPRLAHTSSVTLSNLENILSKEKCLLILDGLDEWTHPVSSCTLGPSDLPHRKARECTILTTTRPWKLSDINLSFSEIDQKLELVGLNGESSDELKRRVISLLCNKNDEILEKNIRYFNSAVNEKNMSNLEPSPLLLMYLLCLWCDGTQLGRSKCELYCQIIELLLKRTFRKCPHILPAQAHFNGSVPQCFNKLENCKRYLKFLKDLGRLAFETLFSKTGENVLAFNSRIAEECLSEEILDLSRLSGILTQDKERTNVTRQTQKTSFVHKTVHEFFAALYISISCNRDKRMKTVLSFCKSVMNILDMSNVFIFISGIDAKCFSFLSEGLMNVINKDKITKTYRSMSRLYDYRTYIQPLKDIQDIYISCINENPKNNDLKLCLQDLLIDRDCHQESYYENLQRLAIHNKDNMKSLCIKIGIHSVQEVLYTLAPFDMGSVDKIYYEGECKESDLILLLPASVKCITVISSIWQNDNFLGDYSSWSSKLSQMFLNMHQLEAINIDCFKMSHDELGEFLNHLRNRKSMKEILLYCLFCKDHGASCDGFNLDLSHHSDLRTLALNDIPLSSLKINPSALEDCDVGLLSKPGLLSSYLEHLPRARKLHSFACGQFESSSDIETMLATLPLLDQVKEFRFSDINLGERPFSLLSATKCIQNIQLDKVTMSGSSLSALVKAVEKLPQTVIVGIRDCNIKPKEKLDEVKTYIQRSNHFEVTFDGYNQYNTYSFVFESSYNRSIT